MTQEEKAKAYDEAIEKLRDFYRDYDTVSCLIDVKEELANLFPALKESEDEKIRKELIEFIKTRGGFKQEWIAWLENIPYTIDHEKREGFHLGYKAALEKQDEQKSAWSEEDEKIYSRIYNLIHAAAFENYDVDEDGKELGEYAKITDWLKSLKDRYTWKPSDIQLECLSDAIKHYNSLGYPASKLQELLDDLKKLTEE